MIGSYTNIINYYKDIRRLHKYGNYSILDINSMIPYEMEIHSLMVLKDIQEESKRNNR